MPGKLDIPIVSTQKRIPFSVWGPLALIGLTIGGYFIFVNNFLRYWRPENWGTVEEGAVYRSDRIMPHLVVDRLQEFGIDVLVNLESRDPGDESQLATIAACEKLGIELKRFGMRGNGIPSEPLPECVRKYARALAAIAEARAQEKVVLIQCAAGRHRTGGMTDTYRMLIAGDPPHDAYDELKAYGWKPRKHQLLADWLNANMASIAQELVDMGVLDAVPDPLPYLGPEGVEPIRRDPLDVQKEIIAEAMAD